MDRRQRTTLATAATTHTSALRCVTVWAAITVIAAAGTALGAGAVADSLRTLAGPDSIDQALVTGSGIGATVLCPWLWLIATLSVLDALRGRVPDRAGWARRLTLLACGVAVTTSVVVSPSHAATGPQEPGGAAETISLSGLPYPDRVSGSQHGAEEPSTPPPVQVSTPTAAAPTADAPAPGATRPNTHRVRAGDTLWAIAGATTAGTDIPGAVTELHRRNRRVIGDDPDLIRPGQVLDLHSEGDEPR